MATEKGVSVFAMPSQRLTGSSSLGEGISVVRASIVSWGGAKNSPLILLFTSQGVIKGTFVAKGDRLKEKIYYSITLFFTKVYEVI